MIPFCISCENQRFVCTGPSATDIDACKRCARAAEIDYQRTPHETRQIAMVLPFAERIAA